MGTSKSTLPRAVELIRVSTEGQAERDTPELQRRALDKLRQSRPCVVVERIEALGVSGALGREARDDLRRLEALSRARAFDELRVWNLDRLTRSADLRERAAIWGFALDAGAVIVDASGRALDPSDESGIGEVDYYLQTFFASRERAKIIARTGAGRRRAAEDGHLSQGSPPYGRRYDHEAKRWVLVPEQAEVYRRIVREIIAGRSTREVVAGLNRDGIPAARSECWWDSSVKRLLHAESIVGRYEVCGCVTEIPAIVDRATWEEAQRALERNRSRAGAPGTLPAMLRRRLACGVCGRTAHVLTWHRGEPSRYGCPAARLIAGEPCAERRTHLVAKADAAVRAALERLLTTPDVLRVAAGLDRGPADVTRWRQQIARADQAAARARDSEARLLRLLDDGAVSEDVARERLSAVRQERAAAAEARAAAEAALESEAAREAARDTLEDRAAELAERVRGAPDAKWGELVEILFPLRQPFGLKIWPDRRITGTGRLPLAPALIERVREAGEPGQSSARCGRIAGVTFSFEVAGLRAGVGRR